MCVSACRQADEILMGLKFTTDQNIGLDLTKAQYQCIIIIITVPMYFSQVFGFFLGKAYCKVCFESCKISQAIHFHSDLYY